MAHTTYSISDPYGITVKTDDCERAERLSRAGLRVTAITGGRDD